MVSCFLTVACIGQFGGSFRFFLSVLSTFSKFDEKNHFFAKNIFVATDGKTAIYQKKKDVTICHHPSRTFEKT